METKWTPGPWSILDSSPTEVRISYIGADGHSLVLAHVFDGHEFDSAKYNAPLIAAAPDLYAALQLAAVMHPYNVTFSAALAKAAP